MQQNPNEQYQPFQPYRPASPFTSFVMWFGGLVLFLLIILALLAGWPTFLAAAPIVVKVIVGLLLALASGAVIFLAVDKFLDIKHKHLIASNNEKRNQERHDVQLHLLQTRIHADERGNRAALITATGEVLHLPSGNFVQPVPEHYAPHTVYHNPKQETRIEEIPNIAPLPIPSVPTLAQLLESREVRPGEETSILGYTDGQPRRGDWDKLHSFFVVGISGFGKSSTVAYYTALAVLHGARLLVIDPDAGEEESISNRIAPLAFALLAPVVSSPAGVGRLLAIAERELAQPSPYPIVWIIDEFSTIMRSSIWASVAPQLAMAIENYAQRGRKRGRTAIVIGQIATSTRTGGTELRASMAATFVHRVPAQQARMVIDSNTAKEAPQLAKGEVYVQLANAIEPYKMTIPLTTEGDMHTVKSLVYRRSGERSNPVPTPFSERSQNDERNTENAHQNYTERVTALYQSGLSKRAIIAEVWGVKPGGSPAWQDASRTFDEIITQLESETA